MSCQLFRVLSRLPQGSPLFLSVAFCVPQGILRAFSYSPYTIYSLLQGGCLWEPVGEKTTIKSNLSQK